MGLTFTEANGNTLCITDSAGGTERESAARRLGVDLDRADERVDSIDQEMCGAVHVWLTSPTGEGEDTFHRFKPPEGWHIISTGLPSTGATVVGLEPEAGE